MLLAAGTGMAQGDEIVLAIHDQDPLALPAPMQARNLAFNPVELDMYLSESSDLIDTPIHKTHGYPFAMEIAEGDAALGLMAATSLYETETQALPEHASVDFGVLVNSHTESFSTAETTDATPEESLLAFDWTSCDECSLYKASLDQVAEAESASVEAVASTESTPVYFWNKAFERVSGLPFWLQFLIVVPLVGTLFALLGWMMKGREESITL